MAIRVIRERCVCMDQCPCIMECPVNAISQDGPAVPVVDPALCIDCARCTRYCPNGVYSVNGR